MTPLEIEHRRERFRLELRPELRIRTFDPWCILVDDAWYQLGADARDVVRDAKDFLRVGIRSEITPRTPVFLASTRYPLLLSIDGVAVRGWPVRVDDARWPVWMFEGALRPRTECGTITAEQTLADVEDLAKLWLRTPRGGE